MLLGFVIVGLVSSNKLIFLNSKDNIEELLSQKLGKDYYQVYDYYLINLPIINYSLIVPEFFNTSNFEIPSFNGTEEEIVQGAIDYVKKFDYTKYISDPNSMSKLGVGNCQALSLAFNKILDHYGITNEIVLEPEHMYNKVVLGDKTYIIDFAEDKINLNK